MVHQHFVGDIPLLLVQPIHIGASWDGDNLIFRSSVWTMEGELVSASYKKFFNWGEKPDVTPPPNSLSGSRIMEKLDGSTLIFSRYKGHTIIRTRGTVDARKQDNGYEIDILCEKYSKFIQFLESNETSDFSYVFEWLSPTNRIVIDYGNDVDMQLTGIIGHDTYSLMDQNDLDYVAKNLDLKRPRTFNYDSITEMKSAVETMRGQEGVCVYYNNGQNILKVKGAEYLFLHRAKSEISSLEKVIDLYMDRMAVNLYVPLSYQEFFSYLETTFDYEIASMARGHVSNICDGMKEVSKILDAMIKFTEGLRSISSRREVAEKVFQAYGNTGRAGIVFKMYDKKTLVADDYKKLLYQMLKN